MAFGDIAEIKQVVFQLVVVSGVFVEPGKRALIVGLANICIATCQVRALVICVLQLVGHRL
jgi:hypothetical protein